MVQYLKKANFKPEQAIAPCQFGLGCGPARQQRIKRRLDGSENEHLRLARAARAVSLQGRRHFTAIDYDYNNFIDVSQRLLDSSCGIRHSY